jgi:hypothetical protein
MKNERVIFKQTQHNSETGEYAGQKEFEGLILDKYRDVSDSAMSTYPCDYYLIETDDGSIFSIRPFEVVRRVKEPLPFEV